jgi:hypothetical protein
MSRYLGRVKVNKVDSKGRKITNLKEWIKKNPNQIYFDSSLEYICYEYIQSLKSKIKFKFHPDKSVFLEGFESDIFVPAHTAKKNVKSKNIKKGDKIPACIKKQKILGASYTADFVLYDGKKEYFIETKGFADDAFKLRFKLFKNTLNKNQHAYVVKSLKELKDLIDLLYEEQK